MYDQNMSLGWRDLTEASRDVDELAQSLALLEEYGAMRASDLAVVDRCPQPTATSCRVL